MVFLHLLLYRILSSVRDTVTREAVGTLTNCEAERENDFSGFFATAFLIARSPPPMLPRGYSHTEMLRVSGEKRQIVVKTSRGD